MKRLTCMLLFFHGLLGLPAWGQADDASNYYGNRSYQKAIVQFEKQIARNGGDAKTLVMLADCYRRTGQTERAEATYAKAVQRDQRPMTWMYYAQMAFTNGKHAEAEAAWMKYADLSGNHANARRARAIATQCSHLARSDSSYDAFEVKAVNFNSTGLDFSPAFLGEGELVFASSRNSDKGRQATIADPWTNGNFVDLYKVTLHQDHLSGEPQALGKRINSKYHEASASFSGDGKTIYFTRSDYHRSKRGHDQQKNTRLKIFRGEDSEAGWKIVEALQFNSSDYSSCHPALSHDGSFLVFSSDRPGGKGGMDLYISQRNGDIWSNPVNLGPEINTPGNELFPSFAPDGRLIFSSDFHVGFGGLDVFVAQPHQGKWANPENFGSPINSARDDFGLVLGKDLASGYFSSNRNSQQDDIFYFSGMPSVRLEGVVIDCQSGTHVPQAEVRVMEDDELVTTIATDEKGNFSLSLPPNKKFVLNAGKEGYFVTPMCTGKATVNTIKTDSVAVMRVQIPISKGSEVFMRDKCCFTLTKKDDQTYPADRFSYQWVLGDGMSKIGNNVEHCFTRPGSYTVELQIFDKGMRKQVATQAYPSLDAKGCPDLSPYPPALLGKVYNQHYGTALPDAELRLTNRCTGEVVVVKSDGNGVYYAPLGKPCDYIVSVNKGNFRPFLVPFSTLSGPGTGSFVLDIPLDFDDKNPAPSAAVDLGQQPVVGQTMEFYHIYFDLNRYDIRRDAVPDLEQLYQLMVLYPGMAGELSAHTDSRASYEYNAWLSEKRARAARDYLIAKGIDPCRITARGFGEMRPKNRCADGVPCSEEQHQRNRRVEFRVTDMGQTIQSREPDRFANGLAQPNSAALGRTIAGGDVDLSGAMPSGRSLPQPTRSTTPAAPRPTSSQPMPTPLNPGTARVPDPESRPAARSAATITDGPVVPAVEEIIVPIRRPKMEEEATAMPAYQPKELPTPVAVPADVSSPHTTTPPKADRESIVYKVQVGVFRNPISDAKMAELMQFGEDVTIQKEGGYTRYLVGATTDEKAAEALRNQIKNSGFSDCFVTGWKNGAMLSKRYE